MSRRSVFDVVRFKADSGGQGTFTALVAVYGNVDRQGDRIVPGAFDKSIARWREAGDPIPVIWSHDWANPMSYIGAVDPEHVATAGRGLEVAGRLDVDDPFAAKVHKLLRERRVTQWSFAYDVFDERSASDGANELLEVDLIETGPTLRGANPATTTVAAKSTTPNLELLGRIDQLRCRLSR